MMPPCRLRRNLGSKFSVDEELGNKLDLPPNITHLVTEGAAPKLSSASSFPAQLPAPTKSPQHSQALTGGASLKFWLCHPMVNPTLDPEQGQEERYWIL